MGAKARHRAVVFPSRFTCLFAYLLDSNIPSRDEQTQTFSLNESCETLVLVRQLFSSSFSCTVPLRVIIISRTTFQ